MNHTLKRVGAVALLVASFTLAAVVIRYQPHVAHYIRSIGVFAYPLAIGIFAIVAAAPFSITDALAIMDGAIFGPLWGSVVNAIGLVLAAMLGYWINSRASQLLDLEHALERLPGWVKRFPVGSPGFLMAVRIIPGFGGTIATATAATFRVPLWVHVWTMCVIAIPICSVFAIFGDRVTVLVHRYEWRVHQYYDRHHPHLDIHWHFHRYGDRVQPTSLPSPQGTPPA